MSYILQSGESLKGCRGRKVEVANQRLGRRQPRARPCEPAALTSAAGEQGKYEYEYRKSSEAFHTNIKAPKKQVFILQPEVPFD